MRPPATHRPTPYSVPSGYETPEEPHSGIYWTHEDADGQLVFHGPYRNRHAALDAISEWVAAQEGKT